MCEEESGRFNARRVDREEMGAVGIDDESLDCGVVAPGDDGGGRCGEEDFAVF